MVGGVPFQRLCHHSVGHRRIPPGTPGPRRMNSILNVLGVKKSSKSLSSPPKTSATETGQIFSVETGQMFAVEAGQISAVETGQMSASETGQMSAVETRQASTIATGRCPV